MKKRVISSLVILLIAIPMIIIGGNTFSVFVTIISLIGIKELIDIRETKKKIPIIPKIITYIAVPLLTLNNLGNGIEYLMIDYKKIVLVISLLMMSLLIYKDNKKYNISDVMYLFGILFFIGLTFNLIILIRNYNVLYFVFILLISSVSDIFAYITGRYIGKTPLLKEFSPKKTWEGLIGGTVFGVFISSLFFLTFTGNNIDVITLVLCVTLLSLIGQCGDLIFSSVKRYYGKKDFSNLIPGHGGVLDRLDSILFVLLAFALISKYFI